MPAPVSATLFAQMTAQPAPIKHDPVNKTVDQSTAAAQSAPGQRTHDKAAAQRDDKGSFEESFARETRKAAKGADSDTSSSKKPVSKKEPVSEASQNTMNEPKAAAEEPLVAVAVLQPVAAPGALRNSLVLDAHVGPDGSLRNQSASPLMGIHGLQLNETGAPVLPDGSVLVPGQKAAGLTSGGVTVALHQAQPEAMLAPLMDPLTGEELAGKLLLNPGKSEALTTTPSTAQVQQPLVMSQGQNFFNNSLRLASINSASGLEAWQMFSTDSQAEVPSSSLTMDALTAARPASVNSLPMLGIGADGTAKFQLPVAVTFGQPQWAGAVAERSAMLFSQNINNAELLLDPPELGRMTVQIQVNNDQASVTFTSANAGVREALDQSGQRLRDLLAEQGIDLVNVDVSDQSPSREGQSDDAADGMGAGNLADTDEPVPVELAVTLQSGIDHYV